MTKIALIACASMPTFRPLLAGSTLQGESGSAALVRALMRDGDWWHVVLGAR